MKRAIGTKDVLPGLALALALSWPTMVSATSISPGFDLFTTDPLGTFVDLPVGIGLVPLQGKPIGSHNIDTIVERLQGISPFDPPSDQGTIPIELVALSLVSVEPIDLGGMLFDLEVIGGTGLGIPQEQGSMTITHGEPNGGTFQAELPIIANLIFTEVGNPANQIFEVFNDVFMTIDAPWSHTKCTKMPQGDFFPGCDPVTGLPVPVFEMAAFAQHTVLPASVPEPTTILLLGLGLAGLGFARRRLH